MSGRRRAPNEGAATSNPSTALGALVDITPDCELDLDDSVSNDTHVALAAAFRSGDAPQSLLAAQPRRSPLDLELDPLGASRVSDSLGLDVTAALLGRDS